MKVVLANCPAVSPLKSLLPPLGLGYIASMLEQAGIGVAIIDAQVRGIGPEETARSILALTPDVVGLTGMTDNRFQVFDTVRAIRREAPDLPIVLGGPHFTLAAEDTIEHVPEVNGVVRGEGERTFLELVSALRDRRDPCGIAGLVWRDGKSGQIHVGPPREFIKNLDELPEPAWHLYEIEKYTAVLQGEYASRAIGVMSSRGCPNNCIYCANSALGMRKLRRRSPRRFIDEIEHLKNEYGFTAFDFWDDTISVVRSHILGICEEIRRRKLDIIWYARVRVNNMDEQMLRAMREAGCVALGYGVESGSPRILKRIKKNITLDQVRRVVRMSAEMGFSVKCFFMFSLPDETPEDVKQTVAVMEELRGVSDLVSTPYAFTLIYPGTELETIARERGFLPDDFSWSVYHEFPSSRLHGENPTIPFYEDPAFPISEIKRYLPREELTLGTMVQKTLAKLSRVRSPRDLLDLARGALRYLPRS